MTTDDHRQPITDQIFDLFERLFEEEEEEEEE